MPPPKDLKLPNIDQERFVLDRNFERIYRVLWAVDPAHLKQLDPRVVEQITQINVKYRAKLAELDAQVAQLEAEAMQEIQAALKK